VSYINWDGVILLIYVDDTVCNYWDDGAAKQLTKDLKKSFNKMIEGTITDFLGVQFERRSYGMFSLSAASIDSVLCDLNLLDRKIKGKAETNVL